MDFAQPSHVLESCHAHLGIDAAITHRRHQSPSETMFVVPGQGIGIGAPVRLRGCVNGMTMERVVVPSILELFADAPANLKSQVWRYRDVAGVEQAMNVATQEKPVGCLVRAAVTVGADMGGLQGWQCPLLGDRAAPLVNVGDQDPERPLPEAGTNEVRRSRRWR